MRITNHVSVALTILGLMASSLLADEKPDKAAQTKTQKEKTTKANPETSFVRLPDDINLDAQQKEAIEALNAEFKTKSEELKKRQGSVLTDAQKQALADAKQAAKDSGKDKAELAKELREAVQLTDEQKAQQAEFKKEWMALHAELQGKLKEILSPEQQARLKEWQAASKKTAVKNPGEKKPVKGEGDKQKSAAKKPADKETSSKSPVKKESEKSPDQPKKE